MKLKLGTRGSPLAVAQSTMFARQFEAAVPGLEVELVKVVTSGDRFALAHPQAKAAEAPAGAKGMFIKELEEALLDGRVDFAVHSGKDLPADLAPGLEIAAYPQREDCRDAYIGRSGSAWAALSSGQTLGTTSPRRQLQALKAKPGVKVEVLRGNIDTRLRKLEEGRYDGIMLAVAGIKRLGLKVAYEPLPVSVMVPAPAQGALAIEARSDRKDVLEALKAVDHPRTRLAVECERAFLIAIGGGCAVPLGALAEPEGGQVKLTVFWSDAQGKRPVRMTRSYAAAEAAAGSARLARDLLAG